MNLRTRTSAKVSFCLAWALAPQVVGCDRLMCRRACLLYDVLAGKGEWESGRVVHGQGQIINGPLEMLSLMSCGTLHRMIGEQ